MPVFVSALDLFSIGIGPSSSHTVGPMRAARAFVALLEEQGLVDLVDHVACTLYGSLGATGIGHGTPDAVIAGLEGLAPETCRPEDVRGRWRALDALPVVRLAGRRERSMSVADVALEPRTRLPGHPNALTLRAWIGDDPIPAVERTWFSIGGGFIRAEGEAPDAAGGPAVPHPFDSGESLLAACDATGLSIAGLVRANEVAVHGDAALDAGLDAIWDAMAECVAAGLNADPGELPGGLRVQRRAPGLRARLDAVELGIAEGGARDRDTSIEWLHAFALAVNEENAMGGRVVTAPTNGAAGIVPAVLSYAWRYVGGVDRAGIRRALLAATAIGSIVKARASISGAEGGCQAEVGSACAMAAAALGELLGGTPRQRENAAEIALEHHLGLTCDPVAGLVQVPCIERNAIAASTAVSASRLALHGDGTHIVSLDTVIETMRQTGIDMKSKYKETSLGGLAVNVIEC